MRHNRLLSLSVFFVLVSLLCCNRPLEGFQRIRLTELQDRISGAWAGLVIGAVYGGNLELQYTSSPMPGHVSITWDDGRILDAARRSPEQLELVTLNAVVAHAMDAGGYAHVDSMLSSALTNASPAAFSHANRRARENILNGIAPPSSGHWLHNPHADDIDFQCGAVSIGMISPGMPATALKLCDKVGHVMSSGDGYYGGVFVAAMHSFAFTHDSVTAVVREAQKCIPQESALYQCIDDIMRWYDAYPHHWRKVWKRTVMNWDKDLGCPLGVLHEINRGATLNAAFVVIGLLYGDGDFGRTIDIVTRCGQAAGSNAAVAGSIAGALSGYRSIPKRWTAPLTQLSNEKLPYVDTELARLVELSTRLSVDAIRQNGGTVTDAHADIRLQAADVAPLEGSFVGLRAARRRVLRADVTPGSSTQFEEHFHGSGFVLTGSVSLTDADSSQALKSATHAAEGEAVRLSFIIDDRLPDTVRVFPRRDGEPFELYCNLQLPMGVHNIRIGIVEPSRVNTVKLKELITYASSDD